MMFTLTGRTIAAFFLGALSSFGLFLLIQLWRWALENPAESGGLPIVASCFWLVAWFFLFISAFQGDGK